MKKHLYKVQAIFLWGNKVGDPQDYYVLAKNDEWAKKLVVARFDSKFIPKDKYKLFARIIARQVSNHLFEA